MEHRNLIAALCMISAFILPINAELKYVDASRLTLIGKVMPTPENVYHRVDTVKYNDMPFQVKRLFTHSAGLVVSFKTNSPTVAARWTTKGKGVMGNVTPICDRGLDLYMNDGGKWIPVGAGTPSAGKAEQERVITKNLKPGVHRFLLYLPLFEEVRSLEIGVDEGSFIEAEPSPFRHTVLMYGSSILHGACASRSGLAYPARMSRNTGINFVNYGLSGNGKMEAAVADMLKDIDADAFILDCIPNPSVDEICDRTINFIKTIRDKHTDAPIIVIQSVTREKGNFNMKICKMVKEQNRAIEDQIHILHKLGFKNLYLIKENHFLGTDHEGTVDGVHPSDLGFERMLEKIKPALAEILDIKFRK